VAVELWKINLDDLLGRDIEKLAAPGRSLRHWLRQQDPLVWVEAVVDDAFTELIGLLGTAAIHPQLAHQAKLHEVHHIPPSKRRPASFSTASNGNPVKSRLFAQEPPTMGSTNTKS
jgi:hypothetical protein